MTAPNVVPKSESDEGISFDWLFLLTLPKDFSVAAEDQYGWWFSKKSDEYNAQEYTDCCKGYEKSLDTVAEFMKENGRFDGKCSRFW